MLTVWLWAMLDCPAMVAYFPSGGGRLMCNESHWAVPGAWPEEREAAEQQ